MRTVRHGNRCVSCLRKRERERERDVRISLTNQRAERIFLKRASVRSILDNRHVTRDSRCADRFISIDPWPETESRAGSAGDARGRRKEKCERGTRMRIRTRPRSFGTRVRSRTPGTPSSRDLLLRLICQGVTLHPAAPPTVTP